MTLTGYRAAQRRALNSKKLRRCDDRTERLFWRLLLAVDPHGNIAFDPEDILHEAMRGAVGWTPATVAIAVGHLVDHGLVARYEGPDGSPWLHLVEFDEHQLAEFLRKRGRRQSPPAPGQTTPPTEPRTKNQEPKVKRTEVVTSVGQAALEADLPSGAVRAVFEAWVAAGGPLKAGATKLTEPRRKVIRARLAEGYTVEQVCRSVAAHIRDPWHAGQNPQKRRYTDLTTLAKSGSKIEAGLALADQLDARTDGSMSEYVRPVSPDA